MPGEIHIVIDESSGTTCVTVTGVQGPGCTQVVGNLPQRLGLPDVAHPTDEYYATPVVAPSITLPSS